MGRSYKEIQRDVLTTKLEHAKDRLERMQSTDGAFSIQDFKDQQLTINLLELELEQLETQSERMGSEPKQFTSQAVKKTL